MLACAMDMMRESPEGYFRQFDGCLIVEPRYAAATEVSAIYRDLAVLCIEKQIRRVVVRPGDDDMAGEHALRVAMTIMLLAGLPPEFKMAVVADAAPIEARYRSVERDLCSAGVDAKLFETEDGALRWLDES